VTAPRDLVGKGNEGLYRHLVALSLQICRACVLMLLSMRTSGKGHEESHYFLHVTVLTYIISTPKSSE